MDPPVNFEITEEDGEEDEFDEEEDLEQSDLLQGKDKSDDRKPVRKGMVGRGGISLGMLVDDGILKPGNSCLTMEYQGKRFIGDLLPDGQIRSCVSKHVFSSPSAWAIHCKQMINPEKKTGCGWSSLKYNGQKLDTYKATWLKKNRKAKSVQNFQPIVPKPDTIVCSKSSPAPIQPIASSCIPSSAVKKRYIVNHSVLGNKSPTHDLNSLISCTTFSSIGRMQPFTITVSSNCLLLIDYHSHLTTSEVIGYLGGYWDVTTSNLAILQAFPCRCRLNDTEKANVIESEIKQMMYDRQLMLVGWYHSHPFYPVAPTLRDVESQMEYQLLMKGSLDSYTPCIGFICSPYSNEKLDESDMQAFWVMPPPENNPGEYGKPMHMVHTMAKDTFLTADVLQDINFLHDYYIGAQDQVQFKQKFKENQTFLQRMQQSLSKKSPITQPGLEMSLTENLTSVNSKWKY